MSQIFDLDTLLDESRSMENQGDMKTALETVERAVNLIDPNENPEQRAAALVRAAEICARCGIYERATEFAGEAITLYPFSPENINALIIRANCLSETDQLTEAEEIYRQAADLSRRMDYPLGLARALHNLANNVYMIRGHFDLALATMSQSSKIRGKLGVPNWGYAFLKAYVFSLLGNERAAKTAMDELLPFVTLGSRLSGLYHFLWGRISLDENDFTRAGEYLRLALTLAETNGAPDLNIWTRLEICRYHRLTDHPGLGIPWATNALDFARHIGYRYYSGKSLVERARAYAQTGDLELSQSDLKQAMEYFEPVQAAYDQAVAALLLAGNDQQLERATAKTTWLQVGKLIQRVGYGFILDRERALAYPLIANHLRSTDAEERKTAAGLLKLLGQVSPPALMVITLGDFQVRQEGRVLASHVWKKRRAGELFRFLLLQPRHTTSRDQIIDALWPTVDMNLAVEQFHQATSALRRLLEPELPDKFPSRYLLVENDQISLFLPPGSVVDFERFEEKTSNEQEMHTLDGLRTLEALYVGDLFPQDVDAPWTVEIREHLVLLHHQILIALAAEELKVGQPVRTIEYCQKVIQWDSWNEKAAELMMRAYMILGSPPQALRVYLDLEKRLEDDLKMRPSAVLRALARQINRR